MLLKERVLDFEEALGVVLQQAGSARLGRPPGRDRRELLGALGWVLAEDVVADRDQPGFDRSTRDGFAVQAAAWKPETCLAVIGQVRAGEFWRGVEVRGGDAVQIMTGAPLPKGADAVVMVEHALHQGSFISPRESRTIAQGENIVRRGSEAKAGQVVLKADTRIGAAEIALAAACGCTTLEVFTPLQVAIISTGDELVELDQSPEPHQIRNSNSYAIAALVRAAGGMANRLAIARDNLEDIRERIAVGRRADMLVLTGGVSVGEYDLVETVLAEAGAEFFFTGVRMQPGKPAVFGRLPANASSSECYFFGLPGNPISAQVTFQCFAEVFLKVVGGEDVDGPRWAQATLGREMAGKPGLTRLLPARMAGVTVEPVAWQGSGDLAANARANCFAELLPGRSYARGEVIRVLLR